MGKLAADLVMSAGEKFHFQKMVAVGVGNVAVAQFREFCFGAGFAGDEALVEFLVPLHPILQQAFRLGGRGTA